jgi:hypothetical protein
MGSSRLGVGKSLAAVIFIVAVISIGRAQKPVELEDR